MHLVHAFVETCRRWPDKTALIWRDQRFTFRQVRERAERFAAGLQRRQVRRGDRVAIFLPNSADTVFAHLGAMMAGGARVPVNAAYTEREARHPIEFTTCRLTVTDSERKARISEAVLAQEVPVSSPVEPVSIEPSDVSLICFTSGTSGKPKGVPLTHANLLSNIQVLAQVWDWTDRDTLLLCLPMMHLHALGNGLNGWIHTGCTMVLQEKFEAEQVLKAIQEHRATMFFGVPAMYHKLLEAGATGRDLSSMRLWVSGSAPLDRGIAERFEQTFGHRIVNRYGMTETAMITANPARGERRLGSVGRALPGMDVRVVDPQTGQELPDGQTGEIVVRGPSLSPGYWNNQVDEATRVEGGFFRTGDLGYRDADGYFFITGRAKDIIISGGTNIAPLEIEEVLLGHPCIAEAVVVPIPDPALGEVVCAVIVPRGPLAEAEVAAWCEQRLAKFKRPRAVRIVPGPLPRNAMQKLDRKRAKELYG